MKTYARARLGRFAPLVALILAAGCADLGVGGAEGVAGLTITDANGGTLVTVSSSSSVSGSLTVARTQSRGMVVVLRSAGGGVVTPGLGESIRVTVTNTQLATWTDLGAGAGTLRGGSTAGQTTLRVDVIDSGTVIYTSPAITVNVT